MTSYVFPVSLEPDGAGGWVFYAPLEYIGASTWGNTPEQASKKKQKRLVWGT
jgi:hypothetical protein